MVRQFSVEICGNKATDCQSGVKLRPRKRGCEFLPPGEACGEKVKIVSKSHVSVTFCWWTLSGVQFVTNPEPCVVGQFVYISNQIEHNREKQN